jgi:hypothetical protein
MITPVHLLEQDLRMVRGSEQRAHLSRDGSRFSTHLGGTRAIHVLSQSPALVYPALPVAQRRSRVSAGECLSEALPPLPLLSARLGPGTDESACGDVHAVHARRLPQRAFLPGSGAHPHGRRLPRTKICVNDIDDLGIGRRLESLSKLHQRMRATNTRYLEVQAELLASTVDGGALARLVRPVIVGTLRVAGLKLEDDRVNRLLRHCCTPTPSWPTGRLARSTPGYWRAVVSRRRTSAWANCATIWPNCDRTIWSSASAPAAATTRRRGA